jgi:hypothetical protein
VDVNSRTWRTPRGAPTPRRSDWDRTELQTADLIEDAIDQLVAEGPALRRPLADRVKGSRYHNMKELRPPSSGTTEIRLLFAFDPRREAIFLVAGDKAGNWDGWYRKAIPLADERLARHLAELEAEDEARKR